MVFRKLVITAVLLCASLASFAQIYVEKFGRNRVQYRDFDWKYITSVNFDIYYYHGGERMAKEVAKFLESDFDRITDLIGYPSYSKTKVFLYSNNVEYI